MYRSWKKQLEGRLRENSTVQTTARGPVEYAVSGEGAPALVLHGVMGGFDQGLAVAEAIALPLRFLAMTRPGYLRTPLDTGRTYEQQAHAAAGLLDSLGVPAAIVIGVSGGGPASLQFASKYAARCTGLILISAVTKRLVASGRAEARLPRLPDFAGWLLHGAARWNPALVASRMLAQSETALLKDPEKRALFLRFLDTSVPYSLRHAGLVNDIAQMRAIADTVPPGIACPTLVIHGTADKIVPYEYATAAAAAIPGARLLSIQAGGHFAGLFHASEARRAIQEFLTATQGQAASR